MSVPRMLRVSALFWAVAAFPATGLACGEPVPEWYRFDSGPPLPVEVRTYADRLSALRSGTDSSLTVEAVYNEGTEAAAKLQVMLDRLAPAEYGAACELMEGFSLWRSEFIAARPKVAFFIALANRHGDAADRAFFALFRETFPDGLRAVFQAPVTDVTYCTLYEEAALVTHYGKWKAFRSAHPGRYPDQVTRVLQSIIRELLEGTCACGEIATVSEAFEAFIRAYPDDELTARIKARLAAVRNGAERMRTRCVPT